MDVYNVPEHGNADAYLIQGTTDPNSQSTNLLLEPFEAMYNEDAPEFVADQSMYYQPINYSYICTGLESPGDWDDHHRVFGVDGQNIQFVGTQTESLPYVYYTPSYGYTQSPYNPYNPYIPGAMIAADGSFVGAQPYFVPYENGVSSPAYFPMDVATSTSGGVDASGQNRNLSSAAATFTLNPRRGASNNANAVRKVPEGFKSNGGPNKVPATNGSVTSNSVSGPASSQILQVQGAQTIDNLSNGKSSGNGRVAVDKVRSKLTENPNVLTTSNSQLMVKAYSRRAGSVDAQGNITICMDDYNKDDFAVEYVNAKFVVIKSYSEDDVHKSIKYNVWSSTPNGNRKLNSAYEEAQKISTGDSNACPIFLFFSVNASGQFCGVAEMTGHVDFHKDMDFWQQDKWSGSFPVKWHIIKDVPNPHFRHIILENNEHKPVTNSRDTQEIKYKKGEEMLKIFKNYASKTSLLDDFMYYENRQKILLEEKARLSIKDYSSPVFVPIIHAPRKLNNFFSLASNGDEKSSKDNDHRQVIDEKPPEDDLLRFHSLAINPEQIEAGNVLTVGSMPVKVNGLAESCGFLTVGTIPLDPEALKVNGGGGSTDSMKIGARKG